MKQMIQKLIFISILIGYGGLAAAASDQTYRADDLVALALERNPELKALDLDRKAQEARVNQAGLWEDPNLDLGVESRTQPSFGTTAGGRIGLSQFINRPGRLSSRKDVQNTILQKNQLELTLSKVEFQALMLQLIYDYRINVERTSHAQERVRRIETVNAFLASRPFLSPQVNAQVAVLKSRLLIIQQQLREFEARKRVAWFRLNMYLGLSGEPKIEVKWFLNPNRFDVADLKARAIETNPDIRRKQLDMKNANAENRLARSEAWSGFTISGVYSNGAGYQPERVYGLGLSFPIPVLNANRGNIEASATVVESANVRLEWEKQRVATRVDAVFADYEAAANSLRLVKIDNVERSEKAMATIDRDFKKGQVDFITYFEADQQHFDSFNTALEVQSKYLSSLSDVLFLVGEAPASSKD